MTEPDLWSALATLRELNKETSSLIEIESQSQKIDKLEKVRNGLEELVARLDRLGGAETGIADQIGSRDRVEDAIRNDLFEDIPKRLAKPLVNQLKVSRVRKLIRLIFRRPFGILVHLNPA